MNDELDAAIKTLMDLAKNSSHDTIRLAAAEALLTHVRSGYKSE